MDEELKGSSSTSMPKRPFDSTCQIFRYSQVQIKKPGDPIVSTSHIANSFLTENVVDTNMGSACI